MWFVTSAFLKIRPPVLGRHFVDCIDWHLDLETAARARTFWASFPDGHWHSSHSLCPAGWATEASRALGLLLQEAQSPSRGTDARRPVQGGAPHQGTARGNHHQGTEGGTLTRALRGAPSPGHCDGRPSPGYCKGTILQILLQPPWQWVPSSTSPPGKADFSGSLSLCLYQGNSISCSALNTSNILTLWQFRVSLST